MDWMVGKTVHSREQRRVFRHSSVADYQGVTCYYDLRAWIEVKSLDFTSPFAATIITSTAATHDCPI